MVTVACVFKSGGDYNLDYVLKLRSSVERNTTKKTEFICLGDSSFFANQLSDNLPGWWSKIELFKLVGNILYFDLDTIILRNIDEMISIAESLQFNEFVGIKAFNPIRNQCEDTKFNSGIMAWNGNFKFIYDNFNLKKAINNPDKRMIGDQDYISRSLREIQIKIKFWQDEMEGIHSYKRHCKDGLPEDAKIICFHGHPRPHEAVEMDWVKENWK